MSGRPAVEDVKEDIARLHDRVERIEKGLPAAGRARMSNPPSAARQSRERRR